MEALDLIVLGRQLARIGERAMRGGDVIDGEPPDLDPTLPAGAFIVMRDLLTHPASSITDITARTGLPQSYVSESVNKLRVKGIAATSADPTDRRRTLVRLTARHIEQVARHSARDVDAVLRGALGDMKDTDAQRIIAILAELVDRLRADSAGLAAGPVDSVRARVGVAGS